MNKILKRTAATMAGVIKVDSEGVERKLHCSIGILADVQYADADDGQDYNKTCWRRFRKAGDCLKEACEAFVADPHPPQYYLQLGDLIDGRSRKSDISSSTPAESMERMLDHFTNAGIDHKNVAHASGNHEFYCFDRPQLQKYLYTSKNLECDSFAFVEEVTDKVVVMHIDSYDISRDGRPENDWRQQRAVDTLEKKNSNLEKNSCTNLVGNDQRFVAYSGGISEAQLRWIDEQLTKFDSEGKLVVIISHCQVQPESSDQPKKSNTVWNFEELLEIIHSHECVVLYAAGHAHIGGYYKDPRGIHHIVMKGIIENTDDNHFGILRFYESFVELEGHGNCETRRLQYPGSLAL